MRKKAIALFVSGRGSNAKAIIEQEDEYNYKVALLVLSSAKAQAVSLAKKYAIPSVVLDKKKFNEGDTNLLKLLQNQDIELIALAGFLWKIPSNLLKAFPNRILNIHPALLPKYGGKGMYGMHIHKAVILNKEQETGISIHLVNERYDEGKLIVQHQLKVSKEDNPESIAARVLKLEHEHYAKTINKYLEEKL